MTVDPWLRCPQCRTDDQVAQVSTWRGWLVVLCSRCLVRYLAHDRRSWL